MGSVVINSLWNANVYLDGVDLLGRAAEIEVPQPKRLMQDYKGLGMAARVEIPVGWDKLESSIKWSSFDYTTFLAAATTAGLHSLMAMGDIQVLTAAGQMAEYPIVCNMTGTFKDLGKIPFKAQENVEVDSIFVVYHVDVIVAGIPIYLFDAFSNQYIVGGVDQLALYRANIGA
jgi:P2 family phage contractile tail tube protein